MKNLIAGILIVVLVGCKISYSLNGADICDVCETVSVDVLQNNATIVNPILSQELTEALRDKFNNETPLTLVKSDGDLQFSGYISDYRVQSIAVQGNETAAMNRLTITIQVQYTNVHEEEKNFDKSFSRYADFESSRNLADVEEQLIEQINEQLVQDVFNQSVVNW